MTHHVESTLVQARHVPVIVGYKRDGQSVVSYNVWSVIAGVNQPKRVVQSLSKAKAAADTLVGEYMADILMTAAADKRDDISQSISETLMLARASFRPTSGTLYFILDAMTVHIEFVSPKLAADSKA